MGTLPASCDLQTGPGGGPCTLPLSLGGVTGLHALDEASRSHALCLPSSPGKKQCKGLWETSRALEPPRSETLGHLFLLQVGKLAQQTKARRPKPQGLSVPEPGLEFRLPSLALFMACSP